MAAEDASVAAASEEDTSVAASWQWPELRFDQYPTCSHLFHQQFKETAIGDEPTDGHFAGIRAACAKNNFLKGVKWSPDGACFLACCEDTSLRLFPLPSDVLEPTPGLDLALLPDEDSYRAALVVWEGETVYDFCWYPPMNASDSSTCVFASTCREHPVHLWDAITGELRCTYRAYDNMDEVTAAFSLAFNSNGSKLVCGYNKVMRVFDVSRPGRQFSEHSTQSPTKEGQTGIISCMAFNPQHPGMLAAGSYNRTVGLYQADARMEHLCVLHGHTGGLTQVQFSKDGNYLYTGARKDPSIICWDVRYTAGAVYRLPRLAAGTNQRIAFDIEPCGRHLASGGEDGQVRVYDLTTGEWVASFTAASDTVNGFQFHPSLPLGVASSGQRRFRLPADSDDEEDKEQQVGDQRFQRGLQNSVSMWRFGCSWDSLGSDKAEEDV